MTFSTDDEFTRNLNERIKELENMTNEINDQTNDIHDQASKGEEATTEMNNGTAGETAEVNQAEDSRTEGDTIFFTANVDSSKPLKMNVTNNNGELDVVGTDIDHVEITATRQSGEDVDHSHWFFQQVDNEITMRPNWQVGSHVGDLANKLRTQLKEGFKTSEWSTKDFKFGMDVNYDIVIRMPRELAEGSKVKLKTASGDGQLRDVKADVDFKTANGDLKVENVGGNLTINSANGDLYGNGISGNAHASTANGDVKLEDVTGSVEANTANGDVRVNGASGWLAVRTANGDANIENVTMKGGRFATVAGDLILDGVLNNASNYSFDSVTGDVKVNVRVPAEGAKFTGRTISGDIDATGEWSKTQKREWVIGDGNGPQLSAKSVSGDVHIHAVVDPEVTFLHEEPAEKPKEERSERTYGIEVDENYNFEIERAKGWIKDIGSRLGAMMSESDGPKSPEAPKAPEAPMAPEKPETPEDPDQKAATAERRAKLLEAVKQGEMTVDEALAELERDA